MVGLFLDVKRSGVPTRLTTRMSALTMVATAKKARLSAVIAAEPTVRTKAQQEITGLHQRVQRAQLTGGLSRVYTPKDDEGEKLPSESTRVQVKAEDVIDGTARSYTELFDIVATKDWANQIAKADVVVDGQVLIVGAPVSYLLFLEKQLTDLHTFVKKLPVLGADDEWVWDENAEIWRTNPVRTHRTKKVYRNHVKAVATDKHPAQVEVYTEDQTIGYWDLVKFSGALPARRVNELLDRVAKLQVAVKHAREEANSTEAASVKVGEATLGWLFSR